MGYDCGGSEGVVKDCDVESVWERERKREWEMGMGSSWCMCGSRIELFVCFWLIVGIYFVL